MAWWWYQSYSYETRRNEVPCLPEYIAVRSAVGPKWWLSGALAVKEPTLSVVLGSP